MSNGIPISLSADLSAETYRPERSGMTYLKCLKKKKSESKIFYPAKLSFRPEEEVKISSDKQKLKELTITKQALQGKLHGLL